MIVRLLAAAVVIGVTGPALAADPGRPDDVFNWSGAYLGAHLGYGWGHSSYLDREYNGGGAFPTIDFAVDSQGRLGGFQGGYNWQSGHGVFGLEGEVGHLNLRGNAFPPGTDPSNVPYDAEGTIKGGWYAGLAARLGYALDRTLLYGKAGGVWSAAKLGYLDICTTAPNCGNGRIDASDHVGLGYQLGAGIEHALSDHWALKVEYSYFDFGEDSLFAPGDGGVSAGKNYHIPADLSVHAVKFGVNYKF